MKVNASTHLNVFASSESAPKYPVNIKINGVDITVKNIKQVGPDSWQITKGYIEAKPNQNFQIEVHYSAGWPGDGVSADVRIGNYAYPDVIKGSVQTSVNAFGVPRSCPVWTDKFFITAPSQKGLHEVVLAGQKIGYIRVS